MGTHHNHPVRSCALAMAALLIVGCAMAWPQSQLLPSAHFVASPGSRAEGSVRLFREGEMPERPVVRVAAVAAHGNGYAKRETLEATLLEEAAKLGADVVIVTEGQVTRDETVGSYGSGILIADQIQRPHLYGVACRWATAWMGVNFDDKDGTVRYVRKNSAAEQAGVREGQKILAINGKFIGADKYVVEREILSKQPGQEVELEILETSGVKRSLLIALQAPE